MVGAVFYGSLASSLTKVVTVSGGDKWLHLFTYCFLMLWFGLIYRSEQHGKLAVLFIGQGVLIEFLQSLTAYRSFEYTDMLANGAGVFLAYLLVQTRISEGLLFLESKFSG